MTFKPCLIAALLYSAASVGADNATSELAITTGTNLGLISGKLAEHQKGVNEVARKRIELIASLERLAAERRLLVDREVAILQQTGGTDLLKLFDAIRTLSDKAAASPAALDATQAGARVELTEGYTPLAISTEKLDEAAKALASLARTSTDQTSLKFLTSYFKEVRESLSTLNKESAPKKEKAEQEMKDLGVKTKERDDKAQEFVTQHLKGAANAATE